MGIVYDYLEFLNQGVLPDTFERPTSPVLSFIVDKARKVLSKSMAGDLVLWMIDHGIDLPDGDQLDPSEGNMSTTEITCEVGENFARQVLETTYSNRFEVSAGLWFQSTSFRRETVAAENMGFQLEQTRHYTHRTWEDLSNSVENQLDARFTWTRRPRSVTGSRKTTGSYPQNSWIPPGYVGPSTSGGDYIDTPVSIPQAYADDTVCLSFEHSRPLCGSKFLVPSLERGISAPCEPVNTYDPDPDFAVDPPPIWGKIVVHNVGAKDFYPAWSAINCTRSEAISFLLAVPKKELTILVPRLSGDPVARKLFGDIEPPEWYVQ